MLICQLPGRGANSQRPFKFEIFASTTRQVKLRAVHESGKPSATGHFERKLLADLFRQAALGLQDTMNTSVRGVRSRASGPITLIHRPGQEPLIRFALLNAHDQVINAIDSRPLDVARCARKLGAS